MHPAHYAAMAASYKFCHQCGDDVLPGRWSLGYRTCMRCGEAAARTVRHCVAPLNKSNYVLVRDPSLLSQLNPKRTT